jgi:porin
MSLGALSAVAAMTCGAAHLSGQTVGDSGATSLALTFSYTGDLQQNAAGGRAVGAAFAGAAGAELTARLGQLVGWHGASIFALVLDTHGNPPSDLVGDVQGVSSVEAPVGLRLEEAWLQQNLFGNRLSWLVGRYDLNTEFYRLQSGALFINSSFGMGPELALSGVAGPSIFPNTAVGTRIDVKPSPNVVWREGMPGQWVMRSGARGGGGLLSWW